MSEAIIIGLDIAKHVFHVHGADERGRAIFRKRISRGKLLGFFASQPSCTVALEACRGAHHWARQLTQLGHQVRLIPPAYVNPFVKRQKNDANDAEAICEAAQRPSMRFVAVKSERQQAAALVFRTRDLLVRQRTQLINAIQLNQFFQTPHNGYARQLQSVRDLTGASWRAHDGSQEDVDADGSIGRAVTLDRKLHTAVAGLRW